MATVALGAVILLGLPSHNSPVTTASRPTVSEKVIPKAAPKAVENKASRSDVEHAVRTLNLVSAVGALGACQIAEIEPKDIDIPAIISVLAPMTAKWKDSADDLKGLAEYAPQLFNHSLSGVIVKHVLRENGVTVTRSFIPVTGPPECKQARSIVVQELDTNGLIAGATVLGKSVNLDLKQ